jgi:O-acetylhomoserine (thiol)-lyase
MAHKDKFPGLCTPDESYHGITYATKFGKEGAFITKCTAQLMRDFGSIQSPMNAYFLNLGLESLAVRMPQHCKNGQAVAEFLEKHPAVERVIYPGLKSNKYYKLAQKYLPNGTCGVISISIKGGRSAAVRFMDALKLACDEVHVADIRTCVLHPASATHRQLTDEQLVAAGIDGGMVRVSVGLENVDDIIEDLKGGLAAV